MVMYTLDQPRHTSTSLTRATVRHQPATPREVMQTADIEGATNQPTYVGATNQHGLKTSRRHDPQEPTYRLPTYKENAEIFYEGAPEPVIDPTRRPLTNDVSDIKGAYPTLRERRAGGRPTAEAEIWQTPRTARAVEDKAWQGSMLRPQSATREVMRVRDISHPPAAYPRRGKEPEPGEIGYGVRGAPRKKEPNFSCSCGPMPSRPQTAAPSAPTPSRLGAMGARGGGGGGGGAHGDGGGGVGGGGEAARPKRPQTADAARGLVVRAAMHNIHSDWTWAATAPCGKELQAANTLGSGGKVAAAVGRPSAGMASGGGGGGDGEGGAGIRPGSRPLSARARATEKARDAADRRADIVAVRGLPF